MAVESDRWVGILDGAAYRIEVPKKWNGMLVMWARGYWISADLYIENPMIRRHLLEQGYAWAASSYTKNFYDVNAAIEDTNKLALNFQRLAAANGRVVTAPRKLLIAGLSMGGDVAAAAVEAEVVRNARNRVKYDGALSMCGSISGLDWYNYMAAYQLAMQQLLGFPAENYPSALYIQHSAELRSMLPNSAGPGDASNAGVIQLRSLMEQLSGGSRPFFREGWSEPYHHNILFGLGNASPTLDGILARNALDTRQVQYQFNDGAPDEASRQFNLTVKRLVPDLDPNPPQLNGLRWLPITPGDLTAPVMTLQTLGDLTVPVDLQVRYRQRVKALGNDQKLTQRLIRDVGHCSFTAAEVVTALEDLVVWVDRGSQPGGDDLLDRQAIAGVAAGCQYTDNRASPDDRADPTKRARIQAGYPSCPTR